MPLTLRHQASSLARGLSDLCPECCDRSGDVTVTVGRSGSFARHGMGVFARKDWRRRPDLNRGWRFCRPLPYHLATAPIGLRGGISGLQAHATLNSAHGVSIRPPSLLRNYGGQLSPAFVSESWSGKRDSNPRLRPWQGRTLPLSYSRPNPQSTTRPGWVQANRTPRSTRAASSGDVGLI